MGRWSAAPLEDRHLRLARARRRRLRHRRRWSARRRSTRTRPGPGESGRADRILDAGFKQPAGESVLIQSGSLDASDPAFAAAIEDVVARVSSGRRRAARALAARPRQRGADRRRTGTRRSSTSRSAATPTTAVDKIDPVLDAVADAQKAHPELFVGEFGDASAVKASTRRSRTTWRKAGLFSLPVTLLILVIAFGALVAAGIPLLLALTAVFATFGLDRAAEPPPADGARGLRDRAPDRARRRRRLLDVLPQARARGARRRAQRAGRARGRRRDLRPLGARSPG